MAGPPPPSSSHVPGTSRDAGQSVAQSKGRIFPCPSCGADLEFHIGVQDLRCPYCGHVEKVALEEDESPEEHDFAAALERIAESRRSSRDREGGPAIHEVRCEACGADVQFAGTLTSRSCAYCGSPIQREGVHDAEQRIPVDGVLPFRVEQDEARANLGRWLRSRWFLPNDLKKRGISEKFHGVYVPYWTYDAMTHNRYVGERGEHYWITVRQGNQQRRVRRTRWYPASGSFQRFFDDVLVVACAGMPRKLLDNLEPWPLARCKGFRHEFLAGRFARTYDVPLDRGFEQARRRIEAALRAEVRRRIGGDEQRVHWVRTRFPALSYKHLLLPVWLLAYRYRGKPYQVAVNAATGEVQGQRPWSWVKILLAVLAAAAVAAGIWFATRL